MRYLPALVLVLVLASCGDDDEPRAASVTTTVTSATTTSAACDAEPGPPLAADGTPAQVVATVGDLQIAVVDHGASVDVVSLFGVVDCELQAVQLGGSPATLAVGGSVTHGDGLRCDEDGITVLSATSDDGVTYQATSVTYRVEGTDLVEADRTSTTIEAQSDPQTLEGYYRLDC
jgi:hypothetical protein